MRRDARLPGDHAPRPRAVAFDSLFPAQPPWLLGHPHQEVRPTSVRLSEPEVRDGGSQDPARCTAAAKSARIQRGPWPLDARWTRGCSADPWGLGRTQDGVDRQDRPTLANHGDKLLIGSRA